MRVGDMIDRVLERSRKRSTNLNSRAAVAAMLTDAYRHYKNQLATQYPEIFTATYRLTLTGVFTPLPAMIGQVVRVEDVSGLGLDQTGVRLVPISAHDVDISEQPGFALDGRRIVLSGRVYDGVEVLIYHRPDIEDFTDENEEPRLVDAAHHDVIWRRAIVEIKQADGMEPTGLDLQALSDAEAAMFASYATLRPSSMWTNL